MKRKHITILFCVAVLLSLPWVMTLNYYRFMMNLIMIYALIAIGLNILVGYMGLASLGHAGLVAFAAYTSALISKALVGVPFISFTGINVWIGALIGPLIAGIVAIPLGYASLKVKGPYFSMVTIAFGIIVHSLLVEWTEVTGGPLGITAIPRASVAGFKLTSAWFYYIALLFLIFGFWIQKNIMNSHLGRIFSAVGQSEIGAASLGINVYGAKITAFVLSAILAGLGGFLFTHEMTYISPDCFDFLASVFFLLIVIFGGKGSLWGPIIGAICLTMLPELLHRFEKFRLIIYGSMMIAALFFLPNGIYGLYDNLKSRLKKKETKHQFEEVPLISNKTLKNESLGIMARAKNQKLIAENIYKYFGGVKALVNIEMKIMPNTIHSLIGPNGAGKTTLLNVIAGIYSPTKGRVIFDTLDITGMKCHKVNKIGIARTFQNLQLFPEMTALQNVITGFHQHRQSKIQDMLFSTKRGSEEERKFAKIGAEILGFLDLLPCQNERAKNLPYGLQKRLEIARALASNPSLLLLDEPAAGLNAQEIEELSKTILKIKDNGMTVLLIEHHMDLVMGISDWITVLDYGIKIAQGIPSEIQSNQKVIEAYLGGAK